ncbi:hypothetical protein SLS57_011723 [Botryosphaeria dothidea]
MRDNTDRSYSFDYGDDVNGFEMNFRMANDTIVKGGTAQTNDKHGEITNWSSQVALVGGKGDIEAPSRAQVPEQKGPAVSEDGDAITPVQTIGPPVAPPRIRIRQTASIDKDSCAGNLASIYAVYRTGERLGLRIQRALGRYQILVEPKAAVKNCYFEEFL